MINIPPEVFENAPVVDPFSHMSKKEKRKSDRKACKMIETLKLQQFCEDMFGIKLHWYQVVLLRLQMVWLRRLPGMRGFSWRR